MYNTITKSLLFGEYAKLTKITSKSVLTKLKEFFWLTVAGTLNAISLYTFLNPSKLIAGGFSGLSSALTYILRLFIHTVDYDRLMSIVYFVLNIPLLICSVVLLRGDFTIKTVYATCVCTGVLAVLPVVHFPQFTESRIIAVIFGAVMIGFAMHIASEYNGSNGGTEIVARIVAKYRPEIDLSKVIMLANFVINVIGSVIVIVIEKESAAVVIYSFAYVILGSTFMGMFKRGFNHPQKFMIVTSEYERLISDITAYFKRGCSCVDVDSDGGDRKIVVVVVQYRQRQYLKQLIKARDPHAFVFVKDVYDVFSRPTFNRSYKNK